jgi:predicted DsbA family dithiol-disulfide isomerase
LRANLATLADGPLAGKYLASGQCGTPTGNRAAAAGIPAGIARFTGGMRVDIWSDIVCPWCYIGKRRFEQGLGEFGHRDEIEVVYRAFELDPSIPAGPGTPILELLSAKYGLSPEQARDAESAVAAKAAADGLAFNSSRVMGNTFDAHRLVRLGRDRGIQGPVLQRLYEAYFAEGRPVFEPAELVALGEAAGLDGAQARQVLAEGTYAEAVRADEQQASALGITGVPFAVLDGKYGVSGAQPAQTFTQVLDRAWTERSASVS